MTFIVFIFVLISTPCDKDFQEARKVYYRGVKNASYTSIKRAADMFYSVAVKYPQCELAPLSLFNAGKAYITLYTLKFERPLIEKAEEIFVKLAKTYRNHPIADDALFKAGTICRFVLMNEECARKYFEEAISLKGDMSESARRALDSMQGVKKEVHGEMEPAVLKDVNWWLSERYVRVSLTFSERRDYSYRNLEEGQGIKVTVYNAKIENSVDKGFSSDLFLRRIRIYNENGNAVVELMGENIGGYQVFHFVYPFSVLIDVFRSDYHSEDKIASIIEEYEKKSSTEKRKIPLVVLDPGHGGSDPGAKGMKIVEKDITLALAKMVKPLLEREGIEVKLTRDDDTFIPLPMRTAMANSIEADLFVSIHTNSSRNRSARGIEVYYFDKSIDPHILEVVARENEVGELSQEMREELSFILADLQLTSKTTESALLAEEIESSLLKNTSYGRYRYKGVKGGPFYVLMNARMPAILIEVCFISNPEEEKLLRNEFFLKKVAKGIAEGVMNYLRRSKEI